MRNPRYLAVGLLSAAFLSMGSAMARADDGSIVLDFVRHGESGDMTVVNTLVPGPDLTDTGEQQAQALVNAMSGNGIDDIYASTMIRSQETAAPLAEALHLPINVLSGLNEIDAGIAFDESFSGAVQSIYDGTVGTEAGTVTDAVFSHEGAIAIWTLMNVNNPDFALVLQEFLNTGELLPYTGQVVVDGSPGDWTLVSWDGTPVSQDPGLPTELFVDFRDLITAPQFASYDIYEALLTGNSATIETAIQAGVSQIDTALTQFPVAVFDDIVSAFGGAI
jgi:hypothetical protein